MVFKSFFFSTALVSALSVSNAVADDETPGRDVGVLPGHSAHGEVFNEGPRQKAYLMGGTGQIHFPVTTKVSEAQAFFNQGVGQLHGYWYFEAERSFRQVAALDTNCVMAYWGMAKANLNNAKRAKGFIKIASDRKAQASPREQLWIDAYANYLKDAPTDEKPGDAKEKDRRRELVRALEKIIYEFPEDVEAKAFLAFEIGGPISSHVANTALIKEVLAFEPTHPVHHIMIHLWDGEDAKRALASAARCGQAAPSIAHMWHMPGHIYTKTHRYADAAWQQEASARVDHAHMMKNWVLPDQIHNYSHNNQWLIENLEFVGRVRDAIDLAKNMIELPRHPKFNTFSRTNGNGGYEMSYGSATQGRSRLLETLTRFELWDDLIALGDATYLEPTDYLPEEAKRVHALGLAHFSKGNADLGRDQITALEGILKKQRDQRQADAERAEAKAKKEKKSDDAIVKAMSDALKSHLDKVRAIENCIEELRGYEHFAKKDYDAAWEKWKDLKDIPKDRLARLRLEAGDKKKAEELSLEAVKDGANRVHLIANCVDVLWRCGKVEKAQEKLEQLRALSSAVDLDVPVFARLKPIAEKLNWPADWRQPAAARDDVGQRPNLNDLGPFRWQPSRAPDWTLSTADGKQIALHDYRGKPVLVIFYLGHGCVHCIEQLNVFAPISKQFVEAGISLVAIGTDPTEGLKKTLVKSRDESGFPFPIVSDAQFNVFKAYRAFDDFEQAPLHGTFLIDGEGFVRWQDISYEPFKETKFLLEEAKRLLKISGKPFVARRD